MICRHRYRSVTEALQPMAMHEVNITLDLIITHIASTPPCERQISFTFKIVSLAFIKALIGPNTVGTDSFTLKDADRWSHSHEFLHKATAGKYED